VEKGGKNGRSPSENSQNRLFRSSYDDRHPPFSQMDFHSGDSTKSGAPPALIVTPIERVFVPVAENGAEEKGARISSLDANERGLRAAGCFPPPPEVMPLSTILPFPYSPLSMLAFT